VLQSMTKTHGLRNLLRDQGLAPKKWMGQNFLRDSRYLLEIISAAKVMPGEAVVEIGAGLGALTRELLSVGARVWAIEFDAGFFRVLENELGASPNLVLIHADAVKYDFGKLSESIGLLKVVANLPYNISSRLLFRFVQESRFFDTLHILLQKEVAERLIASPGSKPYGILSVLLALKADVDILFDIPPRAFFPVPDVVSSLVGVSFFRVDSIHPRVWKFLIQFVRSAFSSRRKTLRNAWARTRVEGVSLELIESAAEATRIDLNRRGETLTPDEFVMFAEAVSGYVQNIRG
jgi:16S rRNA (adenine1518-N6/adenine1519-N6)-dimethyltransferase